MNVTELKPYAVTYSEKFSYEVRAEALRTLGSGCEIGVAINDVLAHPKRGRSLNAWLTWHLAVSAITIPAMTRPRAGASQGNT
jgi:hypothetical protein